MLEVRGPSRKRNSRNNRGTRIGVGRCESRHGGGVPAAAHRQPGRHVCTSALEVSALGSNALLNAVRQGSNGGTGIKGLQQLDGKLALLIPVQSFLPHLPLPLPLHVAKNAIVQGIQVWGLGWQGNHGDALAAGICLEGFAGVGRVSVVDERQATRPPPGCPVHPLPQQVVGYYVSIALATPAIVPTASAHNNRGVSSAKARVAQVHHDGGLANPYERAQLDGPALLARHKPLGWAWGAPLDAPTSWSILVSCTALGERRAHE